VSRLPGVEKHGFGRQRWWKVAVTAAVLLLRGAAAPASVSSFPLVGLLFLFSLPYAYLLFWSLFSPSTFCSFLFSFLPSLCSLISPLLYCFMAVSGGQVCCGGGEQARWLRVLFFFYFSVLFWVSPLLMILSPLSLSFSFLFSFFFLLCSPLFFFCFCPSLSRSPCQYLPGFLVSTVSVPSLPSFCFSQKNCCFPPFGLSFLSQKNCRTLSLSRFPSSFFFKTKSFQLSFFSLKKTSPPFVILLSGRSLLSPPKNCCFSFGFSSLAPCFVSVSPLLLLLAAAGDKAK